jgi:ketosteroid isomerase-like protein
MMDIDLCELVREYYRRLDGGDIDWVVDLFNDDAVYSRAGVVYRGKEEISRFFREARKLTGTHTPRWMTQEGRVVVVEGRYEGRGLRGDEKLVDFCDIWRFDEAGRAVRRNAYLATGGDRVTD